MQELYSLFHGLSKQISSSRLGKDAAGRRMTGRVPLARSRQTLDEVRRDLSEHPRDWETINYIYVLSKSGKLVGVFSVDQLFREPGEKLVREVMVDKLVTARPETDQERVASLALEHSIKAIPLVDREHRLAGVVPSDRILEILHQEHREDLLHMAGIMPHESGVVGLSEETLFREVWHRTPWILVGLGGGLLMAKVIDGFEEVLSTNLVLAAFIPLVVYVANAVGAQSQTLYIRDVAMSGRVKIGEYLARQLSVSGLIGIICGLVVWVLTTVLWQEAHVGMVIGVSIFMAIVAAVLFAVLIPWGLIKLKSDPAIGSGPFATIVQDILSVMIYFGVAWLLL